MKLPQVIKEDNACPIRIWTDEVEDQAITQLKNLSRLPFLAHHGVVAMPDVHAGYGTTVGSVIATQGAIIPAAVGVDIGCGMNAVRLNMKASELPDGLGDIRDYIEDAVPVGTGGRHRSIMDHSNELENRYEGLINHHPNLYKESVWTQLGTLGSGNHFIEICVDENQDVWVMLHSGSRGIGNLIGRYFIEKAKLHMEKYFVSLPDKDLAYLPDNTEDHYEYCQAVQWAQDYARANRKVMMQIVIRVLDAHMEKEIKATEEAINCHHNYVERENHFGRNLWITRKGAIRAREGDLGIIPGSMGQKSYIVRGKGNTESYCSCSHGAGRVMSRTRARSVFTVDDLIKQTEGVECRKDAKVLDEIPGAYKDIDKVMETQKDLVDVVHILKQVLCVKGS